MRQATSFRTSTLSSKFRSKANPISGVLKLGPSLRYANMGGYETSMPQMGYLTSMLFKSYYGLTYVWDDVIYDVHLATCAVRLIGASLSDRAPH